MGRDQIRVGYIRGIYHQLDCGEWDDGHNRNVDLLDDNFDRSTFIVQDTMKIVPNEVPPQMLPTVYNSLLLLCKIFYSLNFQVRY